MKRLVKLHLRRRAIRCNRSSLVTPWVDIPTAVHGYVDLGLGKTLTESTTVTVEVTPQLLTSANLCSLGLVTDFRCCLFLAIFERKMSPITWMCTLGTLSREAFLSSRSKSTMPLVQTVQMMESPCWVQPRYIESIVR